MVLRGSQSRLPGTGEKAKMDQLISYVILALVFLNVGMTVAFFATVLVFIRTVFSHR